MEGSRFIPLEASVASYVRWKEEFPQFVKTTPEKTIVYKHMVAVQEPDLDELFPVESDDEDDVRIKEANKTNAKMLANFNAAKGVMIQDVMKALSSDMARRIRANPDFPRIQDEYDSRALWVLIRTEILRYVNDRQLSLQISNSLMGLRQYEHESLDQYVQRARSLQKQYEFLGYGDLVSEDHMGNIWFAGIHEKFSPIKNMMVTRREHYGDIEQMCAIAQQTILELRDKMEQQTKKKFGYRQSVEPKQLIASNVSEEEQPKPSDFKEEQPKPKSSDFKRKIQCYSCGKMGHFAKECKSSKKQNEDENA